MVPELVGAIGVVIAAIITGFGHRIRAENNDAHGRSLQKLDEIATTVEHIDGQVGGLAEWQQGHERLHERL